MLAYSRKLNPKAAEVKAKNSLTQKSRDCLLETPVPLVVAVKAEPKQGYWLKVCVISASLSTPCNQRRALNKWRLQNWFSGDRNETEMKFSVWEWPGRVNVMSIYLLIRNGIKWEFGHYILRPLGSSPPHKVLAPRFTFSQNFLWPRPRGKHLTSLALKFPQWKYPAWSCYG